MKRIRFTNYASRKKSRNDDVRTVSIERHGIIYDIRIHEMILHNCIFNSNSNIPSLKFNFGNIMGDFTLLVKLTSLVNNRKSIIELNDNDTEINIVDNSVTLNWIYQIPKEYFGLTDFLIALKNNDEWIKYMFQIETTKAKISIIGTFMKNNVKFCDCIINS